jgi:hypothetical protein
MDAEGWYDIFSELNLWKNKDQVVLAPSSSAPDLVG